MIGSRETPERTTGPVPALPGARIADDSFVGTAVLDAWQRDLDARGLRATGSDSHHAYVASLVGRLAQVGVSDVRQEPVPLRRWTPRRVKLTLHGAGGTMEVPLVSPVAYSGSTPPRGVTAPLSTEPAAGRIGLADVPLPALQAQVFDDLDWGGPDDIRHVADHDPATPYERVWLSQDVMREQLGLFAGAGAAGLVLVVDLPAEALHEAYLLYDGVLRGLPAVFVSREQGGRLRAAADRGQEATLVLEAQVEDVETPNVLGVIPGASEELVVLHSHTDGTNGLEDNGPEAILAMAQYLARVPRHELPRSVLILLTTGHFATHTAWGLEAFLERHRDDLVPRIAAALCLEHLGALAWPLDRREGVPESEYEFGCTFASPHQAVIDAVRQALHRAGVTESRVLRPFVPDTTGRSPDGTTWPGDGSAFWHSAGLPSANFITGPGYLLNAGPVIDLIDVAAMRRQAIAFTETVIDLCAVPWGHLHTRRGAHR
ncbi:hypothetical protein B046DRAFT_05850 [Streptomyces sp. LamerLS-316]|uniref:hypothetical protein n=1 Tax=unclassified Streptomyces TaxID=2593676 RepID=UPI0008237EDC|nr:MULTISPECIES: hypothetical protein [unclassified Streptomyces]MYQ42424.1 hypothetical protein [Streptomyces sp. SID4921]SCK53625.1 hypothetical protein B046DRAFT_05850 [Streptomyces sp. LamerLS-316]